VDRGPASPAVLRLAMGMASGGTAICLPGNHEVKLVRALRGERVSTSHGLAQTLEQLAVQPPEFAAEVAEFLGKLIAHFVFDDGRLVVAHAGLPAAMHGRASAAVRAFALYGDTSGESDEFGLPVRYPWAEEYRGKAVVVYGHTPVPEPVWLNRTICIDTGCVFGGRLTALRYPERELVSVPSAKVYYQPARPLHSLPGAVPVAGPAGPGEPAPPDGPAPERAAAEPGELDIADLSGKRVVATRLTGGTVTIRAENSAAAIEALSRFAIDPRWLVYLPPTMAPASTSQRDGFLEHPEDALAAYRQAGIGRVICEEKHMGSRAVVIACRDETVARDRFGTGEAPGVIYTRTGRPFFPPGSSLERELLARVTAALTAAGLWEELNTGWLILDCELLPWSAKAGELIREQYAATGAAARTALTAAQAALGRAAARGVLLDALPGIYAERARRAALFTSAYRRYCWTVHSVDDLRLAPFQILAGEGRSYAMAAHAWHLDRIGRLCEADPVFRRTRAITLGLSDPAGAAAGTAWWEELTGEGGEGMVVKPADPAARGRRGPVQPGLKCRGREYLRLIYGPDYTTEARYVGWSRRAALI
jgi:protein phosphatase